MSSPTLGTGVKAIAAFVKQTNIPWGNGLAIQAGAGDGVEFNSEALKATSAYFENMQVGGGSASQLPGAKSKETHGGSWDMNCYYQGTETFWAKAFGKSATPVVASSIVAGILPATGLQAIVNGAPFRLIAPGPITFTLTHTSGSITVLAATVIGLDETGAAQTKSYAATVASAGPLTYTTADVWSSITSVNFTTVTGTATGELIAVGMGATPSSTVYRHVYQPVNDVTGVYGTLVVDDGLVQREWPYTHVGGFTATWEDGKAGKVVFDLVPQVMNVNQGVASATGAVVAAVLPANGALTVVGGTYTPTYPSPLLFTLVHTSGSITAMTIIVTGTDRDNFVQQRQYTNPVLSAGPLTYITPHYWRTVTSVTIQLLTGTATGETIAVGTTPGVNNSTTTSGITLPSNGRSFVLFQQMHAWINAQTGAALSGILGASDELYLKALEIKADLKLKKDMVTSKFGILIEEPQRDGFLEISLKASFHEWSSENLTAYRDYLSKDLKKFWVRFQGSLADASNAVPYEWDFFFNNVAWKAAGDPNIKGPGVIAWDVEGKPQRALSVPSGFCAGYTDNMIMEMYNLRSSNAL